MDKSIWLSFLAQPVDLYWIRLNWIRHTGTEATVRYCQKEREHSTARLSLLHTADALVMLKNSIAMSKLLYIVENSRLQCQPLLANLTSCCDPL